MIPYVLEPRPDTGVTNRRMAVWLFLASETMLFGALFSAYALLRTAAVSWPAGATYLDLRLGVLECLALGASAGLLVRASRRPRPSLAAALAFAVLFLGLIGIEVARLTGAGLGPATNMFLAMYLTMTGVHVLHVVGGIAAGALIVAVDSGGNDSARSGRLGALALYGGFVMTTWAVIFVLFYLS
jgi:cytochrome c oxidase subunit III